LRSAQNPRYKAVLEKALADLDAQLSTLSDLADDTSPSDGEPGAGNAGVTAHAIAVFGDRERAMDWLSTPNHLFGGKSPEEFAKTGGAKEVERILIRIEYGVFS